jgi:signal transduction histidine kinase
MSIVSDQTSQKRLERELIEAAKLSSIAETAYILAHEINNPLTGIKLGLSTLYQSLQKKENIQILDGVIKDLGRIQKTVQAFLRAQKSPSQLKIRNQGVLREVIEEVLFHLSGQLELKKIRVKKSFTRKGANLLVDRNKLYQLFLNLLLNALQALSEEGQIRITTQLKEIPQAPDRNAPHLCILLSDSGSGIESQHLPHIFKPFYTSKTFGTGLGLSVCKEIVKAHKGFIQVQSRVGKGTTFKVFLPVFNEEGANLWK